uniref:Uncharacterized protein n=1 Tax=Glossina pallidipes TaxID=7398 RepID=A0A1B0A4W4_GLOPL
MKLKSTLSLLNIHSYEATAVTVQVLSLQCPLQPPSSSYALIVSHTQRQSGNEDEFCELYKLMALNTVNTKRNSKTAKHFNSSIKYRPYFSALSNDNETTAIVITLHGHKLHAHAKGQTSFDFQIF